MTNVVRCLAPWNYQSCQSRVGSRTKTRLEKEQETWLTRKLHKYKRNTRTCELDEYAGSSCLARQQLQGVAATRSQPKNLEKILRAGMVRVNTLHNSSRRCSSSWSKGNGSGSSKWDLGDESKSSMRQCTNLSRLCARYLHEYFQEEEIGEFLTKT